MKPNHPRLLAALFCLALSSVCTTQTYSVTDLGPLPGGAFSVAVGLTPADK